MKMNFFAILSFFLAAAPFAFAIPNAPASVWLTDVENPPFDNNGMITVNWELVAGTPSENISRYNIYVTDTATKKIILVGTNTTETTFVFSGYSSGNYTFNVTAVNTLDETGLGRKSDWVLIHAEKPVIAFKDPTPKNNAFTKDNWTTISGSITEKFPEYMEINWNGGDTLQTYVSGILWMFTFDMPSPGKYSYYVWANDSAGTSVKSETRYITYDITKPAISIASPQDNEVYDAASISLDYTASDIGPISCWYTYNFTNTTLKDCKSAKLKPVFDTEAILTLWVNDSAGNINYETVTFLANSPPSPNIISAVPKNGDVLTAPSITGKATDTLTIKTDRQSTCKYDLSENISYNSMHFSFKSLPDSTHTANFTAGDNKSYIFYIRCKSADDVISNKDYVLKFSTAYPEGLIIVDPEKKALNNNSFKIKAMSGKNAAFNISVKTLAAYPLTKYAVKITGDGATYLNAAMPKSLTNHSVSNLTLSASAKKSGNFKATVNLSSGRYSTVFLADLTVFDDFMRELNSMNATSINLSSRIEILKNKGIDISDKEEEFRQIQSGMDEIRALYSDKAYSDANDKYINLSESYAALKQEILSAETEKQNTLPDNSNGSGSGIGGRFSSSTIVIVIVLIIIIIAATAIVSNKKESAKKAEGTGIKEKESEVVKENNEIALTDLEDISAAVEGQKRNKQDADSTAAGS